MKTSGYLPLAITAFLSHSSVAQPTPLAPRQSLTPYSLTCPTMQSSPPSTSFIGCAIGPSCPLGEIDMGTCNQYCSCDVSGIMICQAPDGCNLCMNGILSTRCGSSILANSLGCVCEEQEACPEGCDFAGQHLPGCCP